MQTYTNKIMAKLVIYVIVFTIFICLITRIMSYFNSNLQQISTTVESNTNYAILNLYLLKTVKTQNVSIKNYGLVDNDDTSSYYITFINADGTTSTFIKIGNIIYFNKIKICENVEEFKIIIDKSEKESFSIEVKILDKVYNSQYALN